MFTGIIENLGTVLSLKPIDNSMELRMGSNYSQLDLGESVAVNGVCLTVAQFQKNGEILFFVSPESLEKSNLGTLAPKDQVNLERALTLQTRLSGHLVQGHVDGKAKLLEITPNSDTYSLLFEIPRYLSKYCVQKGSIGLNGVSLTLNSVSDQSDGSSLVGITVIPHTWSHTNLSRLAPGDLINVEVDILAKYVERLCHR
jgi:riboflavin synthase